MNVVDKKKLLELLNRSGEDIGVYAQFGRAGVGIFMKMLKTQIESGELDPDIDPPIGLEKVFKECCPGVEFVTSGEKK
jgi:hypothetical protein